MKTQHWLLFTIISSIVFIPACKKEQTETSVPSAFQKSIGGTSDDLANSIIIKDAMLYIFGQSKSFDDPNGDHYLLKLDIDGNLIFDKTYGGNLTEEGKKIIPTQDGNFILIGSTESSGNGQKDIHVLKIDTEGTVLWEKTFGGALDDTPADIIEMSNSEFCIAATTESFGNGARDIYLIWIDQSGNLIREVTYGGSDIDGSSDLLEIENNQLILYGYTRNFGATSRDFYLMKLTSTGDSIWSRRYGADGYEESQGFAQTPSGGFLMSGHSSSADPNHDLYAIEVDADGNPLWDNHYGGAMHDGGQALLINSDGNYVFIARSMSFGNNSRSIYMVISDPLGNLISEEVIGGSLNDWGEDIIEYDGFYYIVGHSNSFRDGDNDIYLVKKKK
ncbi:MAG: hypothetical protein MK212_07975 [Saprospiraceae bacterium]|nr:hypothetical protein [Saprospiraceae bacterium]